MRNSRTQHASNGRLNLLVVCLLTCGFSFAAGTPGITTTAVPDDTAGAPYSVMLAAENGTPPYTWSVVGGSLPAGLTLNASTGLVAGTPIASGAYNFWVSVTDSAGSTSPPKDFGFTVWPPPSVAATALPNGVLNAPYSATLTATAGTPPYGNWTVVSGTLPPGFALNPATGVFSGIPIAAGFYSFEVTVQDSAGITSSPQLLTAAMGVAITTKSLPNWTVGVPYTAQLAATGGVMPYGWAIVSATGLPPGLTLNSASGTLTGTPILTGSYSITVLASDSGGNVSAPQNYTLSIVAPPAVTTTSLPAAVVSVPYSTTIAVSGGTSPISWLITNGSLPAGLSLYSSIGVISGIPKTASDTPIAFTLQAMDAAGVTASQRLSITVNQASLLVSPLSLTFNVRQDDPASMAAQSVSVFSNTGPVQYSATFAPTSGANWLNLSGGGFTPGNLLVSVNTPGLAANTTYTGRITITGPTLPKAVIVPVTLNVVTPPPAQLSVSPASMALAYAQGYAVEQRYFTINNTGSGTLEYLASATTDSCGSWMVLMNSTGSATAKNPGVLALQVSSAGLSDQTCEGRITVASGTQTRTIPVTMTVSSRPQSVLLSQKSVNFQAPYGGSAPPKQSFAVMNAGAGPIDWTVDSQTLTGGNWLSATPASSGSTTGNVPMPVTLSVDPQGLAPGAYYGSALVTAPGAGNAPQAVTVTLTVAAQTQPQLSPSGVILVGQPATGNSEGETLTLTNLGTNPLTYTSTVVTDNHQNWLIPTPVSGSVAAGGTSTMTLQASLKTMPPGIQHGLVRVAFADGTIHTVDVYLIVPGTNNTPGCNGNSGFVAVFQSPEAGFQASAQTAVPVSVLAKDCNTGKVIKRASGIAAQVLPDLQSGAAVALTDDGTGNWTGTWIPGAASAQTSLTARVDGFVSSTATVVSGQAAISGTVGPAPSGAAGIVTGIQNGTNSLYPGLVAPGTVVSLLGAGLSSNAADSSSGTHVFLQGQELLLYSVDATQIKAVIPASVNANERQQLLVVRDGTMSPGVDVQVAGAK